MKLRRFCFHLGQRVFVELESCVHWGAIADIVGHMAIGDAVLFRRRGHGIAGWLWCGFTALFHKSVERRSPPPHTDLFYGLSDRCAKSSVAIEHGDTDLDFRDLSIEVPRHEALAH